MNATEIARSLDGAGGQIKCTRPGEEMRTGSAGYPAAAGQRVLYLRPMRLLLALLVCLGVAQFTAGFAAAAGPAVAPQQNWLQLTTPSFRVIGGAGESALRRVASRLEQFRETLGVLFPKAVLVSSVPTTVIVFRGAKEYEPFTPLYNGKHKDLAGYFLPGRAVNYVTLNAGGVDDFGVIYHEYVHLVVNNTMQDVPLWFNEGLAEYYATFEVTAGGRQASLGRLHSQHVLRLREQWLALPALLSVRHDSPYYNERDKMSVFYAESWALVHYLLLGHEGKYAKSTGTFVAELANRAAIDQACLKAFGITPAVLERELRRYVEGERFFQQAVTFTTRIGAIDKVPAVPLEPAAAHAALGDLLFRMQRPEEARAQIDAALALAPSLAEAHAVLGRLLLAAGDGQAAMTHLAQAAATADAPWSAHFDYASLLVEARSAGAGTSDGDATIERALRRTIELQPSFPEAYAQLAWIRSQSPAAREEATGLARRALALSPGNERLAAARGDLRGRSRLGIGAGHHVTPLLRHRRHRAGAGGGAARHGDLRPRARAAVAGSSCGIHARPRRGGRAGQSPRRLEPAERRKSGCHPAVPHACGGRTARQRNAHRDPVRGPQPDPLRCHGTGRGPSARGAELRRRRVHQLPVGPRRAGRVWPAEESRRHRHLHAGGGWPHGAGRRHRIRAAGLRAQVSGVAMPRSRVLAIVLLLVPPVWLAAQDPPPPAAPATPRAAAAVTRKLPVRRVVLYKNGVGFFEHLGQVSGTERLSIDFTSAQLDDALKSLTVLDLNGGQVGAVGYNSDAPLERRLGALNLPLESGASAGALLGALRGARIEVSRSGVTASGRLLGVERRRQGEGDKVQDVDYLSIVSDAGDVRVFELGPGTTVHLLERDLNDRVGRYLGLVASERDRDLRRMTIDAAGQGARRLYVSYVSEVPVWKTTYRLVLPADAAGKALLQGWAIVDNTVGEDWEDVELSLVAGAPVSFIQRLSQPSTRAARRTAAVERAARAADARGDDDERHRLDRGPRDRLGRQRTARREPARGERCGHHRGRRRDRRDGALRVLRGAAWRCDAGRRARRLSAGHGRRVRACRRLRAGGPRAPGRCDERSGHRHSGCAPAATGTSALRR